MKYRIVGSLLAALALAFSAAAGAQVSVRDDTGRPLQVKGTATRIVTLAPFLTELVFAAGAGDKLVGVASFSDYPPEAKKLPEVVTGTQFSLEQIAGLAPDLVLAWRDGVRKEDIERMSAFGATVYVAQARSLVDVARLLKVIGLLTGRDVTKAVTDYERQLMDLRKANAAKPKINAFVEIWDRPLTTISRSHFISEALEICHAENVFKDSVGLAPLVTWEEVYARNPYVIISAGSAGSMEEFRSNWTVRQGLDAVKADRLVFIDADTIQRPTPRTPEGIAQLCAGLDKVRPAGPAEHDRPPPRRSQYGM